METDRDRIPSLRMALALLVGAYVAAPAIPGASQTGSSFLVLAGIVLLAWWLQRNGLRVSRSAGVLAGATVLLAYSVSLGLVASSVAAWVVLPAAVAAGVTFAVTGRSRSWRTA